MIKQIEIIKPSYIIESPIDIHEKEMVVKILCDTKTFSHLIRYHQGTCNKLADNFDGNITFVLPPWLNNTDPGVYTDDEIFTKGVLPESMPDFIWLNNCYDSFKNYQMLIHEQKWAPYQAATILPQSIKNEVVMQANLKEWHSMFSFFLHPKESLQILEIMTPLFIEMKTKLPTYFRDIII